MTAGAPVFAALATALVLTVPLGAQAPPLSPLQRAVACAVPPLVGPPPGAPPRVIGSQDPVDRTVFGPGDLIVIDASRGGVGLGERYFVRRPVMHGRHDLMPGEHGVKTAGWIRVVALDAQFAIATIDQACDTIAVGDYLDPFVAPSVSQALLAIDRSGEPDVADFARILFGDDERATAGVGEFMLLDRGVDQGATVGSRFAVYRDKAVRGLPLAPVADAVVVAAAPTRSVVRILAARDAVMSGDLAAPRR